jgi:hypothetical protein
MALIYFVLFVKGFVSFVAKLFTQLIYRLVSISLTKYICTNYISTFITVKYLILQFLDIHQLRGMV